MSRTLQVSTQQARMRRMLLMALGQDEVGRRIKRARELADMSQQDLAVRIGLKHAQQVSKYERGLVEIPTRKLGRIAEVTGRPIEYFLAEEDTAAATGVQPVEGELAAAVATIIREAARLGETAERLDEWLRQQAEEAHRQEPPARESEQ